jgi:hypothetical protein
MCRDCSRRFQLLPLSLPRRRSSRLTTHYQRKTNERSFRNSGDKPGVVVVEIPAKPQWCELRQIVFGWTQVQFPFRVRSGRKLKVNQPPIITVIGKAFFDIGDSLKDQSKNQRRNLPDYAAWEIHPVIKLEIL